MCGSKIYPFSPCERSNMSSYSALGRRWLPIVMAILVLCASVFAQESAKPKQSKHPGKKPAASGEPAQEKKTESAKSATSEAGEGDQEEAKGPWHGQIGRAPCRERG